MYEYTYEVCKVTSFHTLTATVTVIHTYNHITSPQQYLPLFDVTELAVYPGTVGNTEFIVNDSPLLFRTIEVPGSCPGYKYLCINMNISTYIYKHIYIVTYKRCAK